MPSEPAEVPPPPGQEGAEPVELGTPLSNLAMIGGLAAGYGVFGYMALRFLYPKESKTVAWQFVCETKAIPPGGARLYQTPAGQRVNVARIAGGDTAEAFIALSSTCPHLGCKVHWEPQKDRFFCPCHNGTFDKTGKGTGGPPGDAGQSLPRYPIKVEKGLIYIQVETAVLAERSAAGLVEELPRPEGSGHDPCLAPQCERVRPEDGGRPG